MIRPEEYLRKGHLYLETQGGRQELFELYLEALKKGIEKENPREFMWAIKNLEDLLTGNSILFVDTSIPNLATLRRLKPQIKKDALHFLMEHLDLLEKALVISSKASHKLDAFFVLLRFLPQALSLSSTPRPGALVDLALLTFYHLKGPEEIDGTEKEKESLALLLLKGLCRYDWSSLGKHFILDPKLQEKVETLLPQYRPYAEYIELLKHYTQRALSISAGDPLGPSLLAPLGLTEELALMFFMKWEGLAKTLEKEKDNILAVLRRRMKELLPETAPEELLAPIEAHLDSLIENMKAQTSKPFSSLSASTLLSSE